MPKYSDFPRLNSSRTTRKATSSNLQDIMATSGDVDGTHGVEITPMMSVRGGLGGFFHQPIHESLTLAALINGNFGSTQGPLSQMLRSTTGNTSEERSGTMIPIVYSSLMMQKTTMCMQQDSSGPTSTGLERQNGKTWILADSEIPPAVRTMETSSFSILWHLRRESRPQRRNEN